MAFPDSFVEEVRRAADIVRVISDHVPLRRAGTSWKGLCPFHKEKTPSFNVRSEPPVFHCFGCGEGGDVFKFLMLVERVSFPEAVTTLARRAGIAVPEDRVEAGPDRRQREELLALLEAAAEHYQKTFWTAAGARAREYLLGRGFRKDTLERIRAGAARDSWDDLLGALRRRFSTAALVTAGLVLERQDKSGHYDRFRGRVVFPILNEGGKVVGFGARSLDGSEPKYLNSPESPVYHKSRTLYGLSWARDAVRKEGRIVLMEGYLDVARALEAGVGEAVASCGTALTASHARLIRRFTESVFVNFDQDAAGQNAARKSLEALLDEGLAVRVVELPAGEDPDSYLKTAGADAYRNQLAGAPVYMEWLIRRALSEQPVSTPAGKAAYLKALLPALTRIESAVERAAWLPVIADRGGLDERATRVELRKALGARGGSTEIGPVAPPPARRELRPAERWLLSFLARGAEGLTEALEELQEEDFRELPSAMALRAARNLYLHGQAVTAASLEAALSAEAEEERRMLREAALEEPPTSAARPIDCVWALRRLVMERRLKQIQRDLAGAEGSALEALLEEKLTLRRQMANL